MRSSRALTLALVLLAVLVVALQVSAAAVDVDAQTCADPETCADAETRAYDEGEDDDEDEDEDTAQRDRCAREEGSIPLVEAGELDAIFEDMVDELSEEDEVEVTVLSKDPWVIYVDNFLSSEMVDALLEEAGDDFAPSKDETKFCTGDCAESKAVQDVQDRVAYLVGLDEEYMEFIQFVRYKKGQYYKKHHDTNSAYVNMPMGHRVMTVFMYLNTIEDGGETSFPDLNLSVKPVRGRAVIWANVKSSNPDDRDLRTMHEALPVTGDVVKVAANFWLYQYDYRSYWPECTG
ncbi:Prolyl 4-hydroxylase subunit alpha-3 [Hondaea fermentalgiana]|uniref:Prolyl 4-hydroxylase subunit alpha-3 n=1 Tax=Hondaea fermentalgiana TaxID=2315210 RepID=A0A2R5GD73_9STRA|nr:Prolyl 4-hydroxylase subunit alpha-3 [Hondaea fermentalgiana]|eukprot:GBG28249.1 Prolyl 4-hydroxylase subunit alpha-3 [Hondaea fermentalgiana]